MGDKVSKAPRFPLLVDAWRYTKQNHCLVIHTLHNSHSSTVEPQGTCLEPVESAAWLNPRKVSGTCGTIACFNPKNLSGILWNQRRG